MLNVNETERDMDLSEKQREKRLENMDKKKPKRSGVDPSTLGSLKTANWG